jgi:hypothetical protein
LVIAEKSNLPERFFYHPFVCNNKIWIIGGSNGADQFSDIWNSDDGVTWKKIADNLPFGKRDNSQFVLFNSKIYMLNNDVWSSTDGINWAKKQTKYFREIFWLCCRVFDQRIWLLGCNRNGKFKSEICGRWKKMDSATAPPTRGGIAACVFKEKIIMTGGKYGEHPTFRNSFTVTMSGRLKS